MKKNLYLFSTLPFFFGGMNLQSKAFDLDAYWKGVGVGIAETICIMERDQYITNATANLFMSSYRTNFAGNPSFRRRTFEEGVEVANQTHGCYL